MKPSERITAGLCPVPDHGPLVDDRCPACHLAFELAEDVVAVTTPDGATVLVHAGVVDEHSDGPAAVLRRAVGVVERDSARVERAAAEFEAERDRIRAGLGGGSAGGPNPGTASPSQRLAGGWCPVPGHGRLVDAVTVSPAGQHPALLCEACGLWFDFDGVGVDFAALSQWPATRERCGDLDGHAGNVEGYLRQSLSEMYARLNARYQGAVQALGGERPTRAVYPLSPPDQPCGQGGR